MRNHLTVVPDDKLIMCDGQSVIIESGISLLSGHDGLHALQWHESSGEIEWKDTDKPNTRFSGKDWDMHCEHYAQQFDAEIKRLEEQAKEERLEYEEWYNSLEQRWKRLRISRDTKIAETDYLMMIDYPITDECREAFRVYRQALRNITSLPGAPWNDETIPWPAKPDVMKAGV